MDHDKNKEKLNKPSLIVSLVYFRYCTEMRTDGYHYINNNFFLYCSNEDQLNKYSQKLASYS